MYYFKKGVKSLPKNKNGSELGRKGVSCFKSDIPRSFMKFSQEASWPSAIHVSIVQLSLVEENDLDGFQ